MINKSKSLQVIILIFGIGVLIESLYSGFKYGCWGGAIAFALGNVAGFLYDRFRSKIKAIKL